MSNPQQQLLGQIRSQMSMIILTTAMQGSQTKQVLQHFENGANELMKNGFDDNELSIALETSDELERLIRSGLGLADALEKMLKNGWINRISGE